MLLLWRARMADPAFFWCQLQHSPEKIHDKSRPGAAAETATRLYVDRRHAGAPYRQVKARVLHYWGRWSL